MKKAVLEIKPTTKEIKENFPAHEFTTNRDDYRVHLNGVPQEVAYTFRKRKGIYWSETCHRSFLYNKIKKLSCTAFPDNLEINILLVYNEWADGLVSSVAFTRKNTVITVSFCVSINFDSWQNRQWDRDAYISELRKILRKAGLKVTDFYLAEEDPCDAPFLVMHIDFSINNTFEKIVNKSLKVLKTATNEVESKLPGKTETGRNENGIPVIPSIINSNTTIWLN